MRIWLYPSLFYARRFHPGISHPARTSRKNWPFPCRLPVPRLFPNNPPSRLTGKTGSSGRNGGLSRIRRSAESGQKVQARRRANRSTSTWLYFNHVGVRWQALILEINIGAFYNFFIRPEPEIFVSILGLPR